MLKMYVAVDMYTNEPFGMAEFLEEDEEHVSDKNSLLPYVCLGPFKDQEEGIETLEDMVVQDEDGNIKWKKASSFFSSDGFLKKKSVWDDITKAKRIKI